MILWWLYSKVSVKREDERAEMRWKLRLGEKAILVLTRVVDVMLWLGRSWAQYGVRLEGYSCSVGLCFDLGLPT